LKNPTALRFFLFFFFILTSILFSSSTANADTCLNQNPCWVAKSSLPIPITAFGIASDSSGKIYVAGGHTNGSDPLTLNVYDAINDSWTSKASLPEPRGVQMGFTFSSVNNRFYMAGGYDNYNVPINHFFEYNPISNTWTSKASLPIPQSDPGLVAGSNGKIYLISNGNSNNQTLGQIDEYDARINSWTAKAPMLTPRSSMGTVTAPSGKIYIIGGVDFTTSSIVVNRVEEYDPDNNVLTIKSPMPTARAGFAISVNAEGNIIIAGGFVSDPRVVPFIDTNSVEEYNPISDVWATKTPLPVTAHQLGASLGNGGNVQVMGGWMPNGTILNTNYAGLSITHPPNLTVPYFSQNSLPWGPTEYDNFSGKLSNPTMDRWGCVVTSAAMVLRFHNINQFTDGTPIDPGSLNNWLKNNKGYLTGYNNIDGFYSYFNWPAIGKLTKQLFDEGKANVKLTHKRAYPNNNTTAILNEDLNTFPDILGVNNSQTSSHFVVAKGKSNNTYSINDPEWNYPTLNSFNSYTQVDRYIPSNTNLSYLVAVVNPSVELLITDPQNNKTGKYFDNGTLQSSNQINNALYSFQGPISNPNNGEVENLGTGVNEFLLPEPENGKYEIKLSGRKSGFYEMNIASFENNGDNALNKIRGIISSNNDETIEVDYSQQNSNNSGVEKIVTFQTLIDDIKEAQSLKLINKGLSNSLIALLRNAEKNYQKGMKNIVFIQLNIFEKLINQTRGKFNGKILDENVYQILLYDVEYLKSHL